jgi:hypothetical protein
MFIHGGFGTCATVFNTRTYANFDGAANVLSTKLAGIQVQPTTSPKQRTLSKSTSALESSDLASRVIDFKLKLSL